MGLWRSNAFYRLLYVFSSLDEKSGAKGVVFTRMFELCHKGGHLNIIINNVQKIEEISKDWSLSIEDRRQLYKACSHTLDDFNDT
jgi:hypothetical protein